MIQTEIQNLTPIQKFYADQNVFITGSTGFLGAVLLEKLLYSCRDISTIYVLVRGKKGKDIQTRIDELLESAPFARLRNEVPKFQHKVIGISGDCGLPDLGISLQDRQLLINEVSIIFHVAATVRFNEKLKLAVAINVRGTKEILSLAREMPKLKSFVHVSTAFSNVPQSVIEEKFYESPVDSEKLMIMVESMSENVVEVTTPTLLGKWPNTYSYTKAIGENVVQQNSHGIPVGVFRPSIVISAYKEPVAGWINNLYGPTGVCAGAAGGVLRALYAHPDLNANLIPVDMCVNGMISCAWEVGKIFENAKKDNKNFEVPLYHFESSTDQPISWKKFMKFSEIHGLALPSSKAIWYYSFKLYPNYYMYLMSILIFHYLPAILVDGALLCIGKSPKMLKVYKKIHIFTNVIAYFSTRSWIFKSYRIQNMLSQMSEEDKKIFSCDLRNLNWEEFFTTYMTGIRLHLLKEPVDSLKYSIARYKKLYWLHSAVKIMLGYLFIRLLWWMLSTAFYVFFQK